MNEDAVLTVRQVAERMQVSEGTVLRWIKAGKLRAVLLGGSKLGYRIRQGDVERLLDQKEPQ